MENKVVKLSPVYKGGVWVCTLLHISFSVSTEKLKIEGGGGLRADF